MHDDMTFVDRIRWRCHLHPLEPALVLPAPGGLVTGGAAHPCGDRLLLRTYDALLEYVAPPNQPFEAAFAATPRPVPVALELQGEAVTYLADGPGYVTASEGTAPALNLGTSPDPGHGLLGRGRRADQRGSVRRASSASAAMWPKAGQNLPRTTCWKIACARSGRPSSKCQAP